MELQNSLILRKYYKHNNIWITKLKKLFIEKFKILNINVQKIHNL